MTTTEDTLKSLQNQGVTNDNNQGLINKLIKQILIQRKRPSGPQYSADDYNREYIDKLTKLGRDR